MRKNIFYLGLKLKLIKKKYTLNVEYGYKNNKAFKKHMITLLPKITFHYLFNVRVDHILNDMKYSQVIPL